MPRVEVQLSGKHRIKNTTQRGMKDPISYELEFVADRGTPEVKALSALVLNARATPVRIFIEYDNG